MIDATFEAESLCQRQSIRFVSCERIENNLYVYGISRDEYGQIWVMQFNDDNEHRLSECLFTYSLSRQPTIPLCIINDVSMLHAWMRDHATTRGLAHDHEH